MQLNKNKKGFTLLELLIVIAILAVLGAIVIFLLNPAETLRKARDSQRISDLSTIKTALGIYIASKNAPSLDNGTNTFCIGGGGATTKMWVSDTRVTGINASSSVLRVTTSTVANNNGLTNGNGWLQVNLDSLTGGSPISNMPVDPSNPSASDVTQISSSTLAYRFACRKSPLGFEVDAILESGTYGPGSAEDDRAAKDGGNNSSYYEVGTDLTILPGGITGDF